MTNKWPTFITRDLDDTDADAEEMERRWRVYDHEMRVLIAKGGVHQDADGWWFETATGEMIGPDPSIERPMHDGDPAQPRAFSDSHPDLSQSVKRSRGRPAKAHPKEAVTLRIDPRVVERFRSRGEDWRARMVEAIENG